MTTPKNSRKTRVGAAALAATAVGSGVLATQPAIVSQVADVTGVYLAKLKSSDDSAFANSVRNVRESSRAEVLAAAFNS